jgi:pimeloyl-ACP methyl ester carboxylesterase
VTKPTTHTLEVPGAVLTYDVRPNKSSTAPVLFIIGSPMGAGGFVTLAGHFADRTVVTYDPRGVDRSKKDDPATKSTPVQHADDLHRLITKLAAGPVELFATSGGAVNALALVAKHPEQVRTLVAHEPPTAQVLPDREPALAASVDVHETYQRSGHVAGMAKFIALVSHKGPITAAYADQPAPDPAMFGLPTEDDGSRHDPLVGQNIISITHYQPDFDAIRAASTRIVLAAGAASKGRTRPPRGSGRGQTTWDEARHLSRRPRRIPRRRVRPDGRPGWLRGRAAQGPRRKGLTRLTVPRDRPAATPPARATRSAR